MLLPAVMQMTNSKIAAITECIDTSSAMTLENVKCPIAVYGVYVT